MTGIGASEIAYLLGRTLYEAEKQRTIANAYLWALQDNYSEIRADNERFRHLINTITNSPLASPGLVAEHIGRALHTTVSREHAKGYEDGYDAAQLYELTLHSPEG